MYEQIKSGDLIAVSGKGFVSGAIQIGTLGLPNVFGLGKRGWAGMSHVGVACWAYPERSTAGDLLVYESTSFARPPCVRTRRENPKGVQAHYLDDILNGGGDVWHLPLRRPLYRDEEDRMLAYLEFCLGRGYDFIGAGRSAGGVVLRTVQRLVDREDMGSVFCSELVAKAWSLIGILQVRNAGAWSPQRLVRQAVRRGVVEWGERLS